MTPSFFNMLSNWKQLCLSFSHQYVLAQRAFINSHHKFSTHNIAEKLDRLLTFKERSFDFFQKSEKYKDMWVPSNKMFNIPGDCGTDGQANKTMTDLIIDFSVPETVSNDLKNPSCYSSLISGPSQEKSVALVLDHCTGNEALIMANTLFRIVGENFKKGAFYRYLLCKANHWIKNCSSHQELVLWAFIFSLEKSQQSNACFRCIYERFKTDVSLFQCLNAFEMGIICNAWFTSNIIVSAKPMLRVVENLLREEICLSPGVFSQETLSMLKVLRKAGFGTDHLFESLMSSLSSPNARNLNLAQAAHGLALLADRRCLVDESIIQNITHLIKTAAKKPLQTPYMFMHPSRGTRIKDLTRFLWTASCLIPTNVISQDRIASEIIDQVDAGWRTGSFQLDQDCHLLSDFFLSLACWKIYPQPLIDKIIDRNFINVVLRQRQTVRQSRLALFLVAAQIEAPHLLLVKEFLPDIASNLPPYKIEKELVKRPQLARLAGVIDRYREELGWENIRCCTTVPHLNLAGLTFDYEGRQVAVEVLDSYVCMRHSNRPERLLALKNRLSRELGYKVIELDVQQTNRMEQEAEVEVHSYSDQQVTMIRKCLEKLYM
ncbi:uncharacterized protein LOC130686854 [Daphnia carinata]|uniref:uncharacterized protein LOC130686854 n=1 Tax=Daphnia carinata TaxID=120202 RepID=UPI0025805650|nr:uncharacterized protein LOC130686854 [Daphnia carinata]XP_059353586.1 uncharacterized protein LOC130686854 [Daphnia carinata]